MAQSVHINIIMHGVPGQSENAVNEYLLYVDHSFIMQNLSFIHAHLTPPCFCCLLKVDHVPGTVNDAHSYRGLGI